MNFTFFLDQPQRQENVGAAARAMKTMGITQLGLINSCCEHLGDHSVAVAHGSKDILENALQFSSTDEVFARYDFVIGTTGDSRDLRRSAVSPTEVAATLHIRGEQIHNVALLFGTEDYGLSNADLERCDIISTIPMAKPFPAVNLGQSVMVYAYELGKAHAFTSNMLQHTQTTNSEKGFQVLKNTILEFSQEIGIGPSHKAYGRMIDFAVKMCQEDSQLAHYILKKIRRWKEPISPIVRPSSSLKPLNSQLLL